MSTANNQPTYKRFDRTSWPNSTIHEVSARANRDDLLTEASFGRRAKSQVRKQHWPFGVAVFVAAVGLPLALLPASDAAVSQQADLLTVSLMILILSSAWIAALIATDTRAPLATVFWMFNYISAAVVPLAQLSTNNFPNLVDRQYLTQGSSLFLLAGLAFTAGYVLKAQGRARSDVMCTVAKGWRLRLLTTISVLLAARYVLVVGFEALFASRTDVGDQIAQAGFREQNSQVGSALLTALGTAPVFVSLLAHLLVLQAEKSSRRRVEPRLWIVLLVVVNLIVNNPISSARYWTLTIVVGIIFALRPASFARYAWTIIIGVLFALIVFPYSDITRSSDGIQSGVAISPIAEKLSTKDYDQLTMSANGIWWVDKFGHTDGHQILSALAFWVPREIWPGKGLDTGVAIGEAMHSVNVNLSSPLPLEVWVDFGWLGVGIIFFLLAYFAEIADRKYLLTAWGQKVATVHQLVVPVVAGYSFILLRGPLLQSMSRLAVLLACIALVIQPAGRFIQKQDTGVRREHS